MSRTRIIGTVEEAIVEEEALLGRKLPRSFREWLLQNNSQDVAETHIYPVRDERDTRKTWESLAYNFNHTWSMAVSNHGEAIFSHLLPFADSGTDNFFCFDYSVNVKNDEWPVVIWFHESGGTEMYASDFIEFMRKVQDEASE